LVLGALLTLVVTGPSFAQGASHVRHHAKANAADTYTGVYDSTAGSSGYQDNRSYLDSGSMGGIGR
jgi:hypothetical protein